MRYLKRQEGSERRKGGGLRGWLPFINYDLGEASVFYLLNFLGVLSLPLRKNENTRLKRSLKSCFDFNSAETGTKSQFVPLNQKIGHYA